MNDRSTSEFLARRDFVGEVSGLHRWWDFVPTQAEWQMRLRRIWAPWIHSGQRPPHQPLVPLRPRGTWAAYFVFTPKGELESHHQYTLSRLRDQGLPVLVICGAPSAQSVPEALHQYADALYWKGLTGYDFSAYTLALEIIARDDPGADVLVMNDSVFGPFADLRAFMRHTPWALTGFTASALHENHIQSYAFVMKGVDSQRLEHMREVFLPQAAYNKAGIVISCQEVPMARVASRHMKVGACWYCDGREMIDPCLSRPFELVNSGFPFLKRSLLGKMSVFQDTDAVLECLRRVGHPLP